MDKFYSINPNTLSPQTISPQDQVVIGSTDVIGTFNPNLNNIEFFIYDFNNNLIYSNPLFTEWYSANDPYIASSIQELPSYITGSSVVSIPYFGLSSAAYVEWLRTNDINVISIAEGASLSTIIIDPIKSVKDIGFNFGKVKSTYNFLSNKLGTNFYNRFYISEISSDRTELRLNSNFISNESLKISYEEFKKELSSVGANFETFYLNFGNNKLLLSVNILLDESTASSSTGYGSSLLIKLYEPLPSDYNIKDEAFIVTKQADSIAYGIELESNIIDPPTSINIKPANLNINVLDNINNSTDYKNQSTLQSTNSSGSLFQLLNFLSGSVINLTTDYSDYANFINFSSANQRLYNFRQKLISISSSQNNLNIIYSITGSTSSSVSVSSSKVLYEQEIQSIITNFDNYERFLYYDSSSKTWPKSTNTPPYVLYDVNSATANNWYATQSITASEYDQNNQNSLYYTIPQYLRYDSNNIQYLLFTDMVGQMFDEIWLYTQNVTDKLDSNPSLDVGVSPDLVHNVLNSLGVKLYGSNFTNENLFNSLIGLNPEGGTLLPTGSYLITNYVTSSISSSLVPTIQQYHQLTYKKIYHALPYLVKTKGTITGLQALLNIFGVPNTELRINEFGGKNKDINTFDSWQEEFSYAFQVTSSAKVSTPWTASSTPYGGTFASALEFRFKTSGLPINNIPYSQSIVNHSTNAFNIVLEYTGSGYTSSSLYSGSIKDPYYQYATLKFISGSSSASVYLPFYDYGWWSVLVNATTGSSTTYELFVKNTIYSGSDGNFITYQASSSFTSSNHWNTNGQLYFGTGSVFGGKTYSAFSGSYQEIRYYNIPLSESAFNAFVMNPNSIEGNTAEDSQSSKNSLFYRIPLGGELYTGSTSVHPGITGSTPVSQSFSGAPSTASFSGSYTFINNYQTVFFDQFVAGIQNVVSDKIRNQSILLPFTSSILDNIPNNKVLSPYISVQQQYPISSSYTENVNYVETGLSPQNEINEDINSTLGYLNIGEYIGDPRLVSSSAETYPLLDKLRDLYFEKYSSNYSWNDFVQLIEQFDSSLFKMIKDYVPARSSLASGIIIKQTLLERNRYPVPQVNTYTTTSFQNQNQPFIAQDLTISGSFNSLQTWDYQTQQLIMVTSSVYFVTGSSGGSMPNLYGQTQSVDLYSPIIQVWSGTTPSLVGPVAFTESAQYEFYNGELSGSNYVVTNGELNDCNIEILEVYTTSSIPISNGFFAPLTKFTGYDLNVDKTYYISFTVSNAVGAPDVGGVNIIYFDDRGRDYVVYYIDNLAAGASVTVNQLELNNISGKNTLPSNGQIRSSNFTIPLYFSTSTGNGIPSLTNFTIFEAYIEPDCLPIDNNAVITRPSTLFYDVDFSSNQIQAVNQQAILNKTAVPANVPDSYYTLNAQTNPRYDGCRTTSPGFNQIPTIGGLTTIEPNVEQNSSCFLYTPGGRGNSLAERSGSGNYLIGFAIDENGNVYKPTSNTSSLYLPIMYNVFAAGTPVILSKVGSGSIEYFNEEVYPVYKPLVNSQTILRSDTGSLDQNYLVNGYINPISMSLVPGVNTNVGVNASFGNNTSLTAGTTTTASNFITISSNPINAFTSSLGIYNYPQGYTPLRASISGNITYEVNDPGVGPPNSTTVTLKIFENNNVIATRTQTTISGSSNFFGVSASIFLSPGDSYYITVASNNLDLDNFETSIQLNAFTGSGGVGSFSTPYFTTGSNSRNVLTASAGMSSFYGGNWQQQNTLTNGTSSGFSNIQPFTINPLDEIRFEGNESQVYSVQTSSYSGENNTVFLTLNKSISPTDGINLDYFAIRRWIFSVDNLLINTPGTIMGEGFIIPFNSSPEFKTKINTIAKQLQKDGLI